MDVKWRLKHVCMESNPKAQACFKLGIGWNILTVSTLGLLYENTDSFISLAHRAVENNAQPQDSFIHTSILYVSLYPKNKILCVTFCPRKKIASARSWITTHKEAKVHDVQHGSEAHTPFCDKHVKIPVGSTWVWDPFNTIVHPFYAGCKTCLLVFPWLTS